MGSNISDHYQEVLIPVEANLESSNHPNRFGEEKITISDSWYQYEKPLFQFNDESEKPIVQQCDSKTESEVIQPNDRLGSSLENAQRRVFSVSGGSKLLQVSDDQQNKISPIESHFEEWLKKLYEKYGKYQPKEKINQPGTTFVNLRQEPDGSYYSGYEKDGLKHGYGQWLNEKQFYEGHFVDNIREGWGRLLTQDTLQAGFWNGDVINKEMILITKDYKYEGQCSETQPHGEGVWENEFNWYQGFFHKGKKDGKGQLKFKQDQSRYEGSFHNDNYHGNGIYYFPSGKIYQGMFANGKFNGQGEMKWPDGRYYKGLFVNSMKQGKGKFYGVDGSVYEGEFNKDLKNGQGLYTKNGITLNGVWKDDEYQEE